MGVSILSGKIRGRQGARMCFSPSYCLQLHLKDCPKCMVIRYKSLQSILPSQLMSAFGFHSGSPIEEPNAKPAAYKSLMFTLPSLFTSPVNRLHALAPETLSASIVKPRLRAISIPHRIFFVILLPPTTKRVSWIHKHCFGKQNTTKTRSR